MGVLARGREAVARARPAIAATAVAAGVVAVLTIPYLVLQRRGVLANYDVTGFTGLAFLGMLRFGVNGLLSFYVWPRRDGIPQFLGFTTMLLAASALVLHRGRPRGALLAVVFTGMLIGLGPNAIIPNVGLYPLPWTLLAHVVPGFSAMRVPQRFGALATLATCGLAALGLAALRARLETAGYRRVRAALPWVAAALLLAEVTPHHRLGVWPVPVGDGVPESYRWLCEHGAGGALLELPANPNDLYRESTFMYFSVFHWLPLVNGYSAYPPKSYVAIMNAAKALPQPDALESVLRQAQLRWILVHEERMSPAARAAYEAPFAARLRLAARFDDSVLFEVPAS
jgi:hypothetical protein